MAKITDYLKGIDLSGLDKLKDTMAGINFPKFDIPKMATGSVIPPRILTDIYKPNPSIKISNQIDMLNKNAIIREMDNISNELVWQKTELEELSNRLNSITNAIDVKTSLLVFSFVTFIGVIIPFFLTLFSSYFDNEVGRIFLFTYLWLSFVISLLFIFIYILYSYKNTSKNEDIIKNFRLYVGKDNTIKSFKLYKRK